MDGGSPAADAAVALVTVVHVFCQASFGLAAVPTPSASSPHRVDAMVALIAERFFPPGRLLIVSEGACQPPAMDGAVRAVVRDGRWPVFTVGLRPVYRESPMRDGPTPTPCCGWLDGGARAASVVLAGDHNHVRRTFNHLRTDYPGLWNGSAFVFIALCSVPTVRPDSLLRWLMSKQMLHAVVALEQRFGNFVLDEVPMFATMPPYHGIVVCQRDVENLTAVDVWLPASGTLLRDGEELFVPRPSPLVECAQCPHIATRTSIGNSYEFDDEIIVKTAKFIMIRLGCLLEFQMHNEIDFSFNRTWVGSFKRVLRGRADIVMRYVWTTESRFLYFEPSSTSLIETINMYVKGGEPTPEFQHTLAFEGGVVVVLAVLAAINHGLMALRRSLGMDGSERRPFLDALLGVWALYADNPGTKSHAAAWGRPLWIMIAINAVTLNCVRSSLFASSAMRPITSHISSLEELVHNGVTIACHDRLLVPYLRTICPTALDCSEDIDKCIDNLTSSSGDYGLLLNTGRLMQIPVRDRTRIYPLHQPFSVQPVVLYFAKDLPLVREYSRMLARLHSAGLIQENYLRAMNFGITEARTQLTDGLYEPQSLSMEVIGPLVGRMAALLLPIAMFCFICEIVYEQMVQPKSDAEYEQAEDADEDVADSPLDTRGMELTWTVSVRIRRDAVREVSLLGWSRDQTASMSVQGVVAGPGPPSWSRRGW